MIHTNKWKILRAIIYSRYIKLSYKYEFSQVYKLCRETIEMYLMFLCVCGGSLAARESENAAGLFSGRPPVSGPAFFAHGNYQNIWKSRTQRRAALQRWMWVFSICLLKKDLHAYAKALTICTQKNTIVCFNVMKTVPSCFCNCVHTLVWQKYFAMFFFFFFFMLCPLPVSPPPPQLFFLICTNWLCATTSRRWRVKELTLPLNCLRRTAPYPAVVSFIVTLRRGHF